MKTHRVLSGGDRLDRYMMNVIEGTTRSKIQSLIKSGSILVNEKQVKPSYTLRESDVVVYESDLSENNSKSENINYEDIKISILYEDESIIVVDKQPGLVVHPGAGNLSGTLLNGIINKIDVKGFETNPGIVHRLDKETSGVMVLAKNHSVHSKIANQFENRKVKKTYHALVWGDIDSKGTVEGNITRLKKDRRTFIMTESDGRYSYTKYNKISSYGPVSYVKLNPLTGRTHQIRVHMKSIGHPLISDEIYSGGKQRIKSYHVKYTPLLKKVIQAVPRVALHAKEIEIYHPDKNEKVLFSSSLPEDMKKALTILDNYENS